MNLSSPSPMELTAAVRQRANELGFELCGVTPAVRPDGFDGLRRWLDRGFAGEMDYIPRREAAYEHPAGVLPPVRSVVMLAMNYHVGGASASLPLPRSGGEGRGEGEQESLECSPLTLALSPPIPGKGNNSCETRTTYALAAFCP